MITNRWAVWAVVSAIAVGSFGASASAQNRGGRQTHTRTEQVEPRRQNEARATRAQRPDTSNERVVPRADRPEPAKKPQEARETHQVRNDRVVPRGR